MSHGGAGGGLGAQTVGAGQLGGGVWLENRECIFYWDYNLTFRDYTLKHMFPFLVCEKPY